MAAKTANSELFDALVRHQTYLMRYGGSLRNRVRALLDKTEAGVAEAIRSSRAGMDTPVEIRRLQALLATIAATRREAWGEAGKLLEKQLAELAYQEPVTMQSVFATTAPVVVTTVLPAPRLLRAIALSRPFEGRILKQWVQTMAADDIRRLHAAVQIGMVAGESMTAIVARAIGTEGLKGTDGVTEASRRQVTALVRTAVAHVANNARAEFIAENADIVLEEAYVATLDARTTPICKSLDGKRFPVGKGPRPPMHFQCRSLRVPAFDPEILAQRPAKASTTQQLMREFTAERKLGPIKSRDDLPRGYKTAFDTFARKRIRELTGRVPAATSYQQWLTSQTRQFQEDTLGVTKAKLFREGGLKLDRFVAADGTELTLAQLARKHAAAFRAAGLDPATYFD